MPSIICTQYSSVEFVFECVNLNHKGVLDLILTA